MRTAWCEIYTLLILTLLKGQQEIPGHHQNVDTFQGMGPFVGANPGWGALPFAKRREFLLRFSPASPGSLYFSITTLPRSACSRIWTQRPVVLNFQTSFAHLWGTTDPSLTDVHMEPLPWKFLLEYYTIGSKNMILAIVIATTLGSGLWRQPEGIL